MDEEIYSLLINDSIDIIIERRDTFKSKTKTNILTLNKQDIIVVLSTSFGIELEISYNSAGIP